MDKDKQAALNRSDIERVVAQNPDLRVSRELASIAIEKGDYVEAAARYQLIAEKASASGDIATLVETKLRLAGIQQKMNDEASAFQLIAEALAINEQNGNPFDIHGFLSNPAEW